MTELEKNAQNGQAVGFMLIKSADKKISVKGSPYLDMVLADKGGEIPAKMWDYQGSDDEYNAGEIIKVKGKSTNGKMQANLKSSVYATRRRLTTWICRSWWPQQSLTRKICLPK